MGDNMGYDPRCRPYEENGLEAASEAGEDEKVLAVPVDQLHPYYTGIDSWRALPPILTEQVAHFFTHYKDLEKNKMSEVGRWADTAETGEIIRQSIERARQAGD